MARRPPRHGWTVLAALALVASSSCGAVAQTRRPAEAPRAAQPADDGLETRFWNVIKDRNIAADFRTYLDAYPNGRYAAQARARLKALDPKAAEEPVAPAPVPTQAPASSRAAEGPALVQDCETCPHLVLVRPGSFVMGSAERFPFEAPAHPVTLHKPFLIGQREVTFEEWDACVADGGCAYAAPDRGAGRGARPASNLDWDDAQQYVAWLSRKTGKSYRLPTEAEWEFAARGGTTTSYYWGGSMEKGHAHCTGCNGPEPADNAVETGRYPPNPLGLYDVSGNVAEWVQDCWNDSYRGAPSDGSAWVKPRCQERVLRGGSFNNDPRYVRSASRYKYDYDVRFYANGLRVARDP